jgi:hypothetical protein
MGALKDQDEWLRICVLGIRFELRDS